MNGVHLILSFINSTSTGKDILIVLNLSQVSVQLTSSNVKSARGCSSGGIGLFFLQDNKIRDENNRAETNKSIFIPSPNFTFIQSALT